MVEAQTRLSATPSKEASSSPAVLPQTQFSSEIEVANHKTARRVPPSAFSSNPDSPAVTSQEAKGIDSVNQFVLRPPSQPTASPRHFDLNSQVAALPLGVQGEADPQSSSKRLAVATPSNSPDPSANKSLTNQALGDRVKAEQPNGSSTTENLAASKPFSTGPISPVPVDPATNLMIAHAPGIPASHHNLSATEPMAANPAQPSAALGAWQNYDGGTGKVVRTAWLGGSANGAEMHVELRSGSLGPVEVHTVVREGSVGAEIHVENHAAHAILSAALPSLERALGDRDLRVGNIAVYQDHGAGMSGGGNQDPHSGSQPTPQHQVAYFDTPAGTSLPSSNTLEIESLTNSAGGLNIRA